MSSITESIFSCEALNQAADVQWNMNDIFAEDSLTSFSICPEHILIPNKMKLKTCVSVVVHVSVCRCAHVFSPFDVCVYMYVSEYSLALGQAGLYASNICRGLVRVLHGESAEDT